MTTCECQIITSHAIMLLSIIITNIIHVVENHLTIEVSDHV